MHHFSLDGNICNHVLQVALLTGILITSIQPDTGKDCIINCIMTNCNVPIIKNCMIDLLIYLFFQYCVHYFQFQSSKHWQVGTKEESPHRQQTGSTYWKLSIIILRFWLGLPGMIFVNLKWNLQVVMLHNNFKLNDMISYMIPQFIDIIGNFMLFYDFLWYHSL